MRVSINWIKRLLQCEDLGCTGAELVDLLSRRVGEIDGLERIGSDLDGVLVGSVESCQQHPNADRLRCCTVDVGADDLLPIVCGAANVTAGQRVAVATIGSVLRMTDAQGVVQSITISKGKLRGEVSHGMICAEDELGLGDDHSGILVLDPSLVPGTPLARALGIEDEVLEIDNHNINHRPDLWGHIGWAREIAAVLGLDFQDPVDTSWQDLGEQMQVQIDSDACSSYCGALVEGVDNRPSPPWMQALLRAVGCRPRGLLVDLTNYVMLELGEPMHAFDRRQISGSCLLVREARDGEPFTTLDERQHQLHAGDLLIADADNPLALAGIMGGEGSMVRPDTQSVVFEAAIFHPERIRRTRLACALATDSSSRFEKGLPVEVAPAAINRAWQLLSQILPEARLCCRFHAGELSAEQGLIPLAAASVRRLGGVEIADTDIPGLLAGLGIIKEASAFRVPWWRRKDLALEADLVEEVLRLYGYEHLVEEGPRMALRVPGLCAERRQAAILRQQLSAIGWDEVQTYVFTDPLWASLLEWPAEEVVELVNAPAADQAIMRRSLLPTLLQACARNLRFFRSLRIYEIGRVYGRGIGNQELPDEQDVLAGVVSCAEQETPFYQARDAALAALKALGHSAEILSQELPKGLISSRGCAMQVEGIPAGIVGEVDRCLRDHLGIDQRVAYFAIPLGELRGRLSEPAPHLYQPPSRYQQVEREFTWVCPEALSYADIAGHMQRAAKKLYRRLDLVTVYRGDPIPPGHKALSMRITLGSDDHTLSDKELAKAHQSIVRSVESQSSARLRS